MNEREEEKKGRKKTIKENRSIKLLSIKSKYVLLFLVLHI